MNGSFSLGSYVNARFNVYADYIFGLIISPFAISIFLQLPGQIDAFGVEERGQVQQRQGYAALNEQLLSQLNYQLADSDKKVDSNALFYCAVCPCRSQYTYICIQLYAIVCVCV